ncbi:MAG TPA: alpha/beta hydrolase [Solirubrobacteraceae bacterium]|jgi:pimeloyl-ACP methyl ester carboxylesterase
MGSYPVRWVWAHRLAAAGHAVLRFDLPGSGQSAGTPSDPQQLHSWLTAIAQAASWLRHSSGSPIAAIGIGLGGLLALRASADGAAIDDLILWGMPPSGRAETRRLQAFAKLQTSAADGEDPTLPDGWLQCGGYVLSADTIADLRTLRPRGEQVGSLRRTLLLEHDGASVDATLVENLTQAGVAVDTAPGPGYEAMLDSPELSLVPDATIATVAAWLKQDGAPGPSPSEAAPPAGEQARLEIESVVVRERAFTVTHPSGVMFGVLAEPAQTEPAQTEPTQTPRDDLCLICLPAWAERCSGPSRLWVEIARRHAARGLPALRMDLHSIGDSDGPRDGMREPHNWDPERIAQVRRVMDALQERGHGSRFLLIGLCSGAYWAQQTAVADPRVVGVLGLNTVPSPSSKALLQADATRRVLLVLQPSWWRKVARGEVSIKGLVTVAKGIRGRLRARLRRRPNAVPSEVDDAPSLSAVLDRFQERGVQIILGYAAQEPGYRQLEVEGIAQRLEQWPVLRVHGFESSDHNLRAVREQQAIHTLVDDLIETQRHRWPRPSLPESAPDRSAWRSREQRRDRA